MASNLPPHTGNFYSILEAATAAAPDRAAIVEHAATYTYTELQDRALGYSEALRSARICPGARIGVLMERGFEAAAAYFGALAFGAVPILINDALRRRQVAYALETASADALITSTALLSLARLSAPREVSVLVREGIRPAATKSHTPREQDDLAQIVFTSGSTGLPKGVMLSHANLLAGVRAITGYLGLRSEDRTLSLLPFSSVFGLNQLICSVASASTLVVERSPLASRIWETVERERVSVLAAVPPLWHQLLAHEPPLEAIPSLRVLQSAGGHLPESTVRRIRRTVPEARLFVMYGMTEVIRSTFLSPTEVDRRPSSIGRPIPGARVLVQREDGSQCEPGEVGELVHIGPTTALGYWGNSPATEQLFVKTGGEAADSSHGRGFRSGDLVRQDEEGFLFYVGRRDRIIKSRGYRVGPDEIADALHASGELAEAVVDSEASSTGESSVIAYVVLTPTGSLERLRDYCRREMPRYMQPGRIEVLHSIPLLPGGKYDLAGLAKRSAQAAGFRPLAEELTA